MLEIFVFAIMGAALWYANKRESWERELRRARGDARQLELDRVAEETYRRYQESRQKRKGHANIA